MIPAPEVVDRALASTSVDDTIVLVTDTSTANVRWAGNSMTTNGSTRSRRWTVVSIVREGARRKVGVVTSASVDTDDIAAVVRASEDAARAAEPASDAMPLVGGGTDTDWAEPAAHTAIGVFDALARDLSSGFDAADRLYGYAEHSVDTTWLGSSTGLRRRVVQPTGSVEINGKRGDASAWAGTGTRDFTDVDTAALLAELTRRLDWSTRTVALPAGRYDTLLPPSTVADLMIPLMWSMEGRAAEEGRSAFSRRGGGTRVGDTLTELPLTLYSDPALPGLEAAPFVATTTSNDAVSLFDNGMTVDRVEWIRDGALGALAYPRSAAHEFDASVAVPGDNLALESHTATTLDDLIAGTERGLLLTTLWYIREVDPASLLLTGLTRDGVYLVEDGAVTAAVNNFRFNESPLDVLARARGASRTERTLPREWKDWFTRTAMPALRVPDFNMSSVSKAT
ncbi:metallopeptidase TldD-related protein [Rhodococcus sp. HNM0569]|uniref:metallopeptidase TldD-related protein n=1 Tax=Rhodococcus sp. HNM0569 TaxID=2716340 RepID=UPI00146BFF0E|nr:metallopeptidase TldD-related protein [Rhodococcus sp. HNM0569]NLU84931.1 TldD/PmbA family protein [Rhodococcus sp. HNM0569]